MPTLLRSPRSPTDPSPGDAAAEPVNREDALAIIWLHSMGIDPRDYTPSERVAIHRRETASSAPQGLNVPGTENERFANSPDEWTGNYDPIPFRPVASGSLTDRLRQQGTPGYTSQAEHRSPEWYDQEYGHWGSLIRQLEGGQDWGPYRRLEAQQRLEALGPDLVEQYGHGYDPTAGIEAGDYTGERDTRAPQAMHDPAIDGPFAGLESALREGQADTGAYAGLDQAGRETMDSIFPPTTDPSRPSDAMPLPFLEPRTDEERTNDQLMEADRARQARGRSGTPPSAARRFGITPPPLRMTTSAAEMPGPNTAMSSSVPYEGDRPPFPPEWDVNNPEDRQRHFEDVYSSLLDQLAGNYGHDAAHEAGTDLENMPRVGPGSAYSQGRGVKRPADFGLPPWWGDDGTTTERRDWLVQHPEYQVAPDFTDQQDYPVDIPYENEDPQGGGFGWRTHFGGDEFDRYWAGPQRGVGKADQATVVGEQQSRKFNPPSSTAMVDPNVATGMRDSGLNPMNTAMSGRGLDADPRPWWMKLLESHNGQPGGWMGMDPNQVMPPDGGSGNVTVTGPSPQPPPYDWGADPNEFGGPNTLAMGDGQVRSLDEYRQQKYPQGRGTWNDVLDALTPDQYKPKPEQLGLFPDDTAMSGGGAVPRGLGGFGSRYRPQALGGYQAARPLAPMGGFGFRQQLPPMGGFGTAGRVPTSTDFSMQRHFNKPNHTPFDGMLESLAKNSGKIAAGTAIGIGAVAAGASRLFSPFGG